MKMNRTLVFTIVGITLLGSAVYIQRAAVAVFLMEKGAEQRLGHSVLADFDDGLHVILCGAGSPLFDPKRSGPCVAVIAGDALVIVDAGSGSSRQLANMQVPLGQIDAQLLTHFHSDHIDGLGEMAMMRWVNAAHTAPLPVIGPVGTKNIVEGFNKAYAADAQYRHAHHTDKVAPLSGTGMIAREFSPPISGERIPVFDQGGLVITAFTVDHSPVEPAVGYRFDYKGRSAIISGDTRKSANLEKMAGGVDLLVHEALSPDLVAVMNRAARKNNNSILEKITHDIVDYHTSPVEAAEIAEAAQVGHLLYYHIVPPLVVPGLEAKFLEGVDNAYNGSLTVGVDGSFVSLPANREVIELGNLK